jgi:two-component sensor histidine kinase
LPLPSKLATGLSLVLHELATNAAKHGSLSVPAGQVSVEWSLATAPDASQHHLTITWREFDGPPVAPPVRRGFGTGLIEGIIAYEFGGSVAFDFHPAGLQARIVIPFIDSGELAETPSATRSSSS